MTWSIRLARTGTIAAIVTAASWLSSAAAPTLQGQQPQGASQGSSEACTLLMKEDAAAALGGAVTGPKAIADMPAGQGATVSSCEYAGSGYHEVTLNLTRLTPSTAPMYQATCAKKGKEGFSGLGEVACWYNEKHEELHAFKGTSFISVELRGSKQPTDAIIGVMKKALERLR